MYYYSDGNNSFKVEKNKKSKNNSWKKNFKTPSLVLNSIHPLKKKKGF